MSINFTVPVSSFGVGNVPAGKGLATAILFTVECSADTTLDVNTTAVSNASLEVLGWRLTTGPVYVGGGSLDVGPTAIGHEITLFLRAKTDSVAPPLSTFFTKLKIRGVAASGPAVLTGEIAISGTVVGAEVNRAAIDLAIDRSKYMSAITLARTKTACNRLIDFMTDADWLGIVTFYSAVGRNQNLKPLAGTNRDTAKAIIAAISLTPAESSVFKAATYSVGTLDRLPDVCQCAPSGRGMLLLSMGMETVPGYTPPALTPSTLGIALGSSPGVIPAVASQYFMLGDPNDPNEKFRLDKFLLQSLAQLTSGLVIILDPVGTLSGSERVRIPFDVADTDSNVRVLLLVDDPDLVELDLEVGKRAIEPRHFPGAALVRGSGSLEFSLDRTVLEQSAPDEEPCRPHTSTHRPKPPDGEPPPPQPAPSKTWHAVLSLSEPALKRGARLKPIPYTLLVFAESDLRFSTSVHLDSPVVGGTAFLSAWLTEHQAPVTGERVRVWAEVAYPDGGTGTLELNEAVGGRFEAQVRCGQPGTHRFRILAAGRTFRGKSFQRELTRTTFTRPGEVPACQSCSHCRGEQPTQWRDVPSASELAGEDADDHRVEDDAR